MAAPLSSVEHEAGAAVVRLHGDLTIPYAGALYGELRGLAARPGLREVIVDFAGAGRVDSSGVAVISLAGRELERRGVRLEVTSLDDRQRAAFRQLARVAAPGPRAEEPPAPGVLERTGARVLDAASGAGALLGLAGET
ncbi:MAG TPA: STAS domain-containing protein, partial [Kofleriaceae bacterium]|nr:STAS domain-containing protein [Kofleriaceae bacterium]